MDYSDVLMTGALVQGSQRRAANAEAALQTANAGMVESIKGMIEFARDLREARKQWRYNQFQADSAINSFRAMMKKQSDIIAKHDPSDPYGSYEYADQEVRRVAKENRLSKEVIDHICPNGEEIPEELYKSECESFLFYRANKKTPEQIEQERWNALTPEQKEQEETLRRAAEHREQVRLEREANEKRLQESMAAAATAPAAAPHAPAEFKKDGVVGFLGRMANKLSGG